MWWAEVPYYITAFALHWAAETKRDVFYILLFGNHSVLVAFSKYECKTTTYPYVLYIKFTPDKSNSCGLKYTWDTTRASKYTVYKIRVQRSCINKLQCMCVVQYITLYLLCMVSTVLWLMLFAADFSKVGQKGLLFECL